MGFTDPAFLTPSLRENPFLQDYFREKDENSNNPNNPCSPLTSPDNNREDSPPNPFIRSLDTGRDFDHDKGVSFDHKRPREPENPFVDRQKEKPHLGTRIIDLAMDPLGPFDGSINPGRLGRIYVLAEAMIEEDNKRKEEQSTQKKSKDSKIEDRVWDYACDPDGDFGSISPDRLKRVAALAKSIPEDGHIIQKNPSDSDLAAKRAALDNKSQNENPLYKDESSDLSFKERIKQNLKKVNSAKKAWEKVEDYIEKHVPKMETHSPKSKGAKILTDAYNASQDQQIKTFENYMRGIFDSGIHLVDLAKKGISKATNTPYSSKEFLEKNLLGRIGDPIQNISYWAGMATFELANEQLIVGKAIKYGGVALSKAAQAVQKAGLESVIALKLTTGAIGKGLNQYISKASGGNLPYVHHKINPFARQTTAVLEKCAKEITHFVQENPAVLEKLPALAVAAENVAKGAIPFLKETMKIAGIQAVLFSRFGSEEKNSVLEETASIANAALEEIAIGASYAKESFSEFSKVVEELGDLHESYDHYQEFVYRSQMKNFLRGVDCSDEALLYVMKKLPKRKDFKMDSLEEIVKSALNAEKMIRYCNRYVQSEWVRDKLLKQSWSECKHYVLDPSLEGYSQKFKNIVSQYHLDLNKHWNLMRIPRHPKIAENYHVWVLKELENIHQKINEINLTDDSKKQEKFLQLFEEKIKNSIWSNPLICTHKWYKYWRFQLSDFDNETDLITDIGQAKRVHLDENGIPLVFKLHKALQFRHYEEGGAVEQMKSLLYWDYEKIAKETEPLIGKGVAVDGKKLGEEGFQEVVKFNEICGEAYVRGLEKWIPTQYAKIHYRLNGQYHIVPFYPRNHLENEHDHNFGENEN